MFSFTQKYCTMRHPSVNTSKVNLRQIVLNIILSFICFVYQRKWNLGHSLIKNMSNRSIQMICIIPFLVRYRMPCSKASTMFHYSGCILSYGEDCRYPCSKHCFNQTCNRFNGICQLGCESGYHGYNCEQGIFIWIVTRKLIYINLLRIFSTELHTCNTFRYIRFQFCFLNIRQPAVYLQDLSEHQSAHACLSLLLLWYS